MDHIEHVSVNFDYTSFLGASCDKKWTFLEAMSTFAPIFSVVWREATDNFHSPEDRLWDAALRRLSTNRSDESNLITLFEIAKGQGIERIKLVMPYSLDRDQIVKIESRSHVRIAGQQGDEIVIVL
ncbi:MULTISPECIES: transporter [unclassified Vibrio]|uniref:transporter n=1 Tax=unclassified Vibrio TaxID=2614977 RepID=UPI001361C4AD|nr:MULTISPECIES: transporter [unclassified Vibrio]NAW57886.1 transporter [Vibrio sp. V36_P2S2PM302]NAX19731.1 transporter [Vibrio sp. V39_P1S14PM300]NAX27953.1 transporter [Vibrio sp. V38_P2S17PM301]NAX28894.1 transporter [Vibrio sp. V37_P2S8PM304]